MTTPDVEPHTGYGRSDEIAAAVFWLCSPGGSFVLGVTLPVDGGFTAQLTVLVAETFTGYARVG